MKELQKLKKANKRWAVLLLILLIFAIISFVYLVFADIGVTLNGKLLHVSVFWGVPIYFIYKRIEENEKRINEIEGETDSPILNEKRAEEIEKGNDSLIPDDFPKSTKDKIMCFVLSILYIMDVIYLIYKAITLLMNIG